MKNIINNINENYKLVLGVLVVGLFFGWLFFHPSNAERGTGNQIESHEGRTVRRVGQHGYRYVRFPYNRRGAGI